MRIVVLVISLLVAARPAAACGFWSMVDKEKSVEVGYLINSASITSTKTKKRVGAFYLDTEAKDGIRVVKNRKVVFDVKGDKLRKFGKVVATIDGDTIKFGKKTYTIELTDPHRENEMPTWKVAVKRDADLILEAEHASALCAGMKFGMMDDQSEEEVRRRVMFYLAWREVGAT